MSPNPTASTVMLPPVMDTINKRLKTKRVSGEGPAYAFEDERKKSTSLSSLVAEENFLQVISKKEGKSNSAMQVNEWRDDIDIGTKKHRLSDDNHKKKRSIENVFDYDRLLREEKNEFNFRLANIPKPSGKLEDFRVLKGIACGKFGKVYLVQDYVEKRQYALKTISKDVIVQHCLEQEIKAERDYLYATNSPFVVSLISHFEDAQRVYFLQEYVSNGDIFEHLKQNGPFSEELTRFYTAQVVLALEYLHNVHLIYRDIKPENVILDTNGYLKLVDFGFVKRVKTKTDTMVGTPAYMAPEMILNKAYDKTVDWWALGILVYEMLSGCQVTPFADPNKMTMYAKITNMGHKEIAFSNKFPRTAVKDLIKRFLKVNPAIRLGNGPNGSKDVKSHPWLASMKWDDLHRRALAPPVKACNSPGRMEHANTYPKYTKVGALKQSLLGASSSKAPDTIKNRVRLERSMMMY